MLQTTTIVHKDRKFIIEHPPDVPRGLDHFETLKTKDPYKLEKYFKSARDADKNNPGSAVNITLHIDGADRKYSLKHTGYDKYKFLPI